MPTKFCLVRHGETAWNVEGRLQGQLDVPLNELGRAQARALAARLAAQRFDALYSSDLSRTIETAEAVAALLGLRVEPAADLRERFFGAFQGLTRAEAEARFPLDYTRFAARDPDHRFPGDAESLRGFSTRVASALDDLADRRRGATLLVVTHGGVLDIVHRMTTGAALETKRNFTLYNTALNWVERRDGQWTLLGWADTEHLPGARDEISDGAAA